MNDLEIKLDNNDELSPSNEIFKSALDLAIKNGVADLVFQEKSFFSIITSTKKTKRLNNLNKNIANPGNFIQDMLNDIIKDSDDMAKFVVGKEIKELNIGLTYNYQEGDEKVSIRLRFTLIKELRGYQINIRLGRKHVPSPEELDIPQQFQELLHFDAGLILVTGATGSGKTTVINSLLKETVTKRNIHLLTLEDPVEYVYDEKDVKSLITYMEQGKNFTYFSQGLKNSLRLSPKIILIGEIRDAETANAVMEAVLGGHLVISTLHTDSVLGTIQKIVKWAESGNNVENVNVFANFLKGILVQKLIETKNKDGKKQVIPIRELLYGNKKIAKAIKDILEDPKNINKVKTNMLELNTTSFTMNAYLINLYIEGQIQSIQDVYDNTNDIDGLIDYFKNDKLKFQKIFEKEKELFETLYKKYSNI